MSSTFKKAILVNVIPHEAKKHEEMAQFEELNRLVETYGGIVVMKILQKRGRPSARTFLGPGKVEEVRRFAAQLDANLVVVNDFLKPNQANNLRKLFQKPDREHPPTEDIQIEIWDRFELILKIFEKHAGTPLAKLEIELARLKYEFPKLFNKGKSLSQQAGHIGLRGGAGEKLLEIKQRHLRSRIKEIENKLEKYRKVQAGQRTRRKRQGFKLAALVGYTNSGKSTIFKALTKKTEVYIADELFATLETKIAQLAPPVNIIQKNINDLNNLCIPDNKFHTSNILISDTIGFIKDLPPILFQSFLATLEESQEADLILHVIDAADPKKDEKIVIVEEILTQLGCGDKPTLKIYNKTDLMNKKNIHKKSRKLSEIHISALDKNDIKKLQELIGKLL